MTKTKFKDLRETIFWTTSTGDEFFIEEMKDSHLQNCIIYLTKKQLACDELGIVNTFYF